MFVHEKIFLRWVQNFYYEIVHEVHTKFIKRVYTEVRLILLRLNGMMLVTVRRHGDNRQVICSDTVRHPRDDSDRKIW